MIETSDTTRNELSILSSMVEAIFGDPGTPAVSLSMRGTIWIVPSWRIRFTAVSKACSIKPRLVLFGRSDCQE